MSKPPLIWVNVTFFAIMNLVTLVAVPCYAYWVGFDGAQLLAALLLLGFSGMAITMGYHRLWSHRTYEAHPIVRGVLAFGGALAIQNSILHWSSDHRTHHQYVDNRERDPYAATNGFWFSHMGWMLREYQPERYADYANVEDLQKDPIVRWQHQHYWRLAWLCNLLLVGLLGLLHGDMLGMALLAGFARITLGHHFTFFINSLAHIWGRRPYSDENTARDNGLLAFFTYGEGYHNFHHRFASDYRNGIRWWQFDPTKWAIQLLSWVGLTTNLRRISDERIERARAQLQLNRACSRCHRFPNREELLERLNWEYDSLVKRMHEFYQAKKKLLESRRTALNKADVRELSRHCRRLKQAWRYQQRQWRLAVAVVW